MGRAVRAERSDPKAQVWRHPSGERQGVLTHPLLGLVRLWHVNIEYQVLTLTDSALGVSRQTQIAQKEVVRSPQIIHRASALYLKKSSVLIPAVSLINRWSMKIFPLGDMNDKVTRKLESVWEEEEDKLSSQALFWDK